METPQTPMPPPTPTGASGPRASFFRRLGAYLLDIIMLAIVGGILGAILADTAANAIAIVIGLAYFAYFEGSESGQTVGKRALGIRVIDFRTGGPIGFGRGLLRYIGKIISSIPASSGSSGCSGTARSRPGTTRSGRRSSCRCPHIRSTGGRERRRQGGELSSSSSNGIGPLRRPTTRPDERSTTASRPRSPSRTYPRPAYACST
jgi:hypothetical protein